MQPNKSLELTTPQVGAIDSGSLLASIIGLERAGHRVWQLSSRSLGGGAMADAPRIPRATRREQIAMAIAILSANVILVGALMFLNTRLLDLGDPAWGAQGWRFYWPIWVAFSLPAALVIAIQSLRLPSSRVRWRAALLLLTLSLVFVEAAFVLDLHWSFLLAEFAAIYALSEALVRTLRSSAQQVA